MFFHREIRDLSAGADLLRRGRYGMIEARAGEFRRVVLRPWPKLVSLPGVYWARWFHDRTQGDWCRLYYLQPRHLNNFLALNYIVSGGEGSLATLRRALEAFDAIAWLKQTDALVCDAANSRISHRLLLRWGWTSHCDDSVWHRHYIKRFYGTYPAPPTWIAKVLPEASLATV